MRRNRILTVGLLAAVVAVALAAADRPRTGVIRGTIGVSGSVAFEGTPPAPESIDVGGDPYCAGAHEGGMVVRSPVVVGGDGGLRDVVVHLVGAPGGAAPPDEDVVLDQRGCQYHPHVLALQSEQSLTIRNSDATLHNVHVSPEKNKSFNIGQPIQGMESHRSFALAELPIHVNCDVHGWMHSVIAVFDHPFFDVSDESGHFEIPNLPPGEYTVEAWHETLGTLSETVRVEEGGVTTLELVFGG